MTRPRHHSNIAARMGRWSAAHWKTATFGWLAFVIVAFGIGGMVGVKNIDPTTSGPGESGRMNRVLDAGFKQPAGESVLIQSRSAQAGTPAFDAAVADVVARVSKIAVVQDVRSPLEPANAGQIAKDGRSALVEFDIRGKRIDAGSKIGPVLKAVDEAQAAHPGLFIGEFGDASSAKAVDTLFAKDLERAGVFSVPLTLIILVIAFGALVAAGIPLLLALTAVFATFGLVALPSHLIPLDQAAPAVVLLIGLAVGVDYSMFYLRREREERAAGRSEQAALEAAAATSGRSVLISGLTVMVAMAGMFLTGDAAFASFGYATIIVVAVAMLGSLTVLPALLSKLGDRVDRLRSRSSVGGAAAATRGPVLGSDRRRRPAPAGAVRGALRRPAGSARAPGDSPANCDPGGRHVPEVARRREDLRPHATGLSGERASRACRGQGPDVNTPAVRDAIAS